MTNEKQQPKERIAAIIDSLNAGMHERKEIVAVSLLAALAGQNTFLLGPPGTAKSLIARRLSCAFSQGAYFGYLMQRFSTPEEVFGPVSIRELKEDRYVRKTEGFLPTADFAFLDEIWKAGSAILNTLLTIVNEKIFRNGPKEEGEDEKVPLKALIAASNETPAQGQGLEALYDRFIVRLHVPAMLDNHNFVKLLHSPPMDAKVEIPPKLAITNDEWIQWQKDIHKVEVSGDTIKVVQLIKAQLAKNKKLNAYISDRRWQKAMHIIKAAAFFCGRQKTNLADTLLLRHCLWDSDKNREAIIKIVEDAVKVSGFSTGQDFGAMFADKDKLEKEIWGALFYEENVYVTDNTTNGIKCYVVRAEHSRYGDAQDIYIPVAKLRQKDKFYPLTKNGEQAENFLCQSAGPSSILISGNHGGDVQLNDKGNYKESVMWCPETLHKKGDRKEGPTPNARKRLADDYRRSIRECKDEFCTTKSEVEARLKEFEGELDSPFVPAGKRDIAVAGVQDQLRDIEEAIQHCDHLNELASD